MSGPWEDFQSQDGPWAEFAKPKPLKGRAAADRDAARRVKNTPDQARAVSKGFSFGFADELDAAGAALETGASNVFKRATGQKPEYGMGDAYGAVMDANAKADNIFAREHPIQNVGLQIAGGAVGPGVAAGARYVGGARSLAGATVRSAAVGGAAGAVAGAGSSRGMDRVAGAGKGAVTGAVVGTALPAVGRAAQTAGRAADNATGGRLGNLFGGHEVRALDRVREALRRDGADEAAIARVTQEWEATGAPPPMLMNVAGENTRRLVRLAGMKEGDAATTLGGMARRERANMPATARARARELTPGEARPANVVAEAATEARSAAAQRGYAGPYAQPVQVPDTVRDMLRDPSGRAIVARARADAVENGDWAMQAELEQILQGGDGPLPRVSAGTLDRLSIAARERAGTFVQRGARNRARGSLGRRDQIEGVLEQVPEIQPARGNYRAHSQFVEGVEDVGPNVLKQTADEFAPQFEAIPEGAIDPRQAGARIGARQVLTDAFGQTPRKARTVIDSVADADDAQRNLRSLFGGEADRFVEAVRRIRQRVDDAQFVDPNAGSKTAPAQADAQAANDVVQVLQGNGMGVLLQKLRNGLTLTEQEAAIIARIATSEPRAAMGRLAAPTATPAARVGNIFATGLPQRARAAVVPASVSQGREGY